MSIKRKRRAPTWYSPENSTRVGARLIAAATVAATSNVSFPKVMRRAHQSVKIEQRKSVTEFGRRRFTQDRSTPIATLPGPVDRRYRQSSGFVGPKQFPFWSRQLQERWRQMSMLPVWDFGSCVLNITTCERGEGASISEPRDHIASQTRHVATTVLRW